MYVVDAEQAPSNQRDPNEFCFNCQFFQSTEEAGEAPCVAFMGKLVNARGWCTTWVQKGGTVQPSRRRQR